MTVRREQFTNNALTTLNGSVNATQTTITVADGSVFPAFGDYRLLVESEVMLVTARTTNDITVVRGVDGTSNISHADTLNIQTILTANALEQALDDVTGGYSDRYPFRLVDQSGVTLNTADFTWANQGTATVADEDWGGITMTLPVASGEQQRHQYLSAPSAPWIVTGFFLFGPGYNNGGGANSSYCSLLVRESDTGKHSQIEARIGGLIRTRRYNSPTSYNSEQDTMDFSSDRIWLQIEDDNSNLYFRCSSDGINFFETANYGRTVWHASAGPDQIGFAWNSDSGEAGFLGHLFAFVVE